MADGVAIALGIASFGIQVCQGLISYYQAWKGCPNDVEEACNKAKTVEDTFDMVKKTLDAKSLEADRTAEVQECLMCCKRSVDKLDKAYGKIRDSDASSDISGKAKKFKNRALYPFKANTFAKLSAKVDDVMVHLSLTIQMLGLDLGAATHDMLSDLTVRFTQSQIEVQERKQKMKVRKVKDWLGGSDASLVHMAEHRKHDPGTGSWFFGSQQYTDWRDTNDGHLWLHGKAGCGKTVLCSTIIDDLQKHCNANKKTAVVFFYFSFSSPGQQKYDDVLKCFLRQLCSSAQTYQHLVRRCEDSLGENPSTAVLQDTFDAACGYHEKVFICLDALDEIPQDEQSDQRKVVLGHLCKMASSTTNLKILMTSRRLEDIERRVAAMLVEPFSLPSAQINRDITMYVTTQFATDPDLQEWQPDIRSKAMETFARKSDGMFRWAYCQLGVLKNLHSKHRTVLDRALDQLPKGLDATYERMLSSINDLVRDQAKTMLQWLAFALRPLSLDELHETRLIDPSARDNIDWDDTCSPGEIIAILGSLVQVDKGCVELAHLSVKEYLISDRAAKISPFFSLEYNIAHHFIAQSCLVCLVAYARSARKHTDKRDSLLGYAAKTWNDHLKMQDSDSLGRELILLQDDQLRRSWTRVYDPSKRIPLIGSLPSALYYASLLGLEKCVRALLRVGSDDDSHTVIAYLEPAFLAAIYSGHAKTAQVLIEAGADVNQSSQGRTPLFFAIGSGSRETVQTLLDAGADAKFEGESGWTVLHEACVSSRSDAVIAEMVNVLIGAGADVNSRRDEDRTPLMFALAYANELTATTLLDLGADTNAWSEREGSALHMAVRKKDKGMVLALLAKGADINACSGSPPVLYLVMQGHWEVELLLSKGADANQRYENTSPLQQAVNYGLPKLVAILTAHGADIKAWQDSTGCISPFDEASKMQKNREDKC